jgi:hypothetical protein
MWTAALPISCASVAQPSHVAALSHQFVTKRRTAPVDVFWATCVKFVASRRNGSAETALLTCERAAGGQDWLVSQAAATPTGAAPSSRMMPGRLTAKTVLTSL